MKKILLILARLAVVIVALPVAYLFVSILLSVIPVNRSAGQPVQGIEIFAYSNGVHVELIVPLENEFWDWSGFFPQTVTRMGNVDTGSIAIGWGDRNFYLHTPTWADLTISNAMSAVFTHSPAVLHVTHLPDPGRLPDVRRMILTSEQYRRLCNYILESLQLTANGATLPIPGASYGAHDAFYEATGNYTLIHTCNSWTGRALKTAGIKVGFWTPFAFNLLLYL